MPIERQSVPYAQIARFNPDGTIRGHMLQFLHRVIDTDTGEVIAETEGPALAIGDAAGEVMLETALGAVGAALARAEEIERGRRAHAEDQRDAARESAEQARADAAAAREDARIARVETAQQAAESAARIQQLELDIRAREIAAGRAAKPAG